MGHLDGIDAISILQNETETPIVVISAHLTDDVSHDPDQRRITYRVKKAFQVEHVIEIIEKALS